MLRILILISGVFLLASCEPIGLYESHENIKAAKWYKADTVQGNFIISDTMASYSLAIVLRHKDSYEFNNIWLNIGLQAPGDSMYYQKINFTLGNDATGWDGAGMSDIWEVRKLLNAKPQRFKKAGVYKYNIIQLMRQDPLPAILSAGMRVQKATS